VDSALEIIPAHVKSHFRKGLALHALGDDDDNNNDDDDGDGDDDDDDDNLFSHTLSLIFGKV
jgi:hypothetical protein